MVTPAGLEQQLAGKIQELKQVVSGIGDEKALKRPADGEWCIKEVFAHLTDRDSAVEMYEMDRFIREDTPALDLTPGKLSFGPAEQSRSVQDYMSHVESLYAGLGQFFAGLTEDQMARKAHVPFLKETPLGEYPTLGQWAGAIVNFHMADHINQVRALAQ